GSISANPLYVGGANYRLTSNSPARRSDATGTDLGAFPYTSDATPGLYGTLWVDTTVSLNATLTGDLTVAPGVTLTVLPGVTLTAPLSDIMLSGNDTSRVELIVRGTLNVSATAGSPVVFTSTGTTNSSWVGLRVESGGAASLTGVTIMRAQQGVDAWANVSLTDATLSTNTYGVRSQAGTTTITRGFFLNNAYGATGAGGVLSVDHSTLVGNGYGVYSSTSSGSLTVSNSIVTGNGYGVYRASGSAGITNTYNDVWQNSSGDYYLASAGTGSFSSNPLYVGGTSYRLTSNSPARKSDSTAGDLGAFPYVSDATPGLYGTLWSNTTVSTSTTLGGDLTVAPGGTLTLTPGVTLTAPTSDLMSSGSDSSRTELIVRGSLQGSGVLGSTPITLTSTGATAGSWTGVWVPAGGSLALSGALIQRALTGVQAAGGTATLTNSRLTGNTSGARATAGSLTVNFTILDGNSYGAYAEGGALTMDHDTLYANGYGVWSASSAGSVGVLNSIFTTHSSYGLYRSSGAVTITNSSNLLFNSPTYLTTTGANTLTSDPLLASPGTGDFRLQSTSPARGAGTQGSDLGAISFAPGPVSRVVIAPTSATVAAGGTFTFTASAFDAQNNPVPNAAFTWSALAAAGAITSSGVLTASCTPGSVTNGVTVTSNGQSASANVTVTTAPVASLVVTPGSATVRSRQQQPFTVTAFDACNNLLVSPAVTWTATGSAGVIDAAGLYTAGCSRGVYANAIVATVGAITGRASVTVAPGVLSSVTLSPLDVTLPINATRQFTGTAADGCGNAVTAAVSYATTVPGSTISSAGLFTAGTSPGTFTGGVTASATEGAVTRGGAANVTVTGGAVASVSIVPATATVVAGGTTNFMAVALDSAGNMVAGTPTWSVVSGGGSITQAGVFTAGTVAGTFTSTIRATISGVSGQATVIVRPGAVTRVVVTPATTTLAPGGTSTFTAQAFDANDNVVSAPVTWSASAGAGTITQGGVFTAGAMAGTYTAAVTATVSGVSATANVVINAGALAQLTVSPAVATTQAGGTVAFTATGRDANGNSVTPVVTWAVVGGGGAISAMGVFTAGTATGTFTNTVRAESNGVTAFATVSVTPGPLVRLELTPASASLLVGMTQQFSAAGKDAFGNPVPAAVTWTANPTAGVISPAGLFTAGALAGDYGDAVRATSGTVDAVASVRVTAPMAMDAGVDAGVAPPDAGAMTSDAGVAPPDAGAMTSDAGMGAADAGPTTPDAGAGGPDAGPMTPDAGSSMQADAGPDGPPPDGRSGCGCTQTDVVLPLAGLAVLALRRRRR
ncbi:MAG: hypothetical protein INH37_06335, partial [Myxococcaceae bacterium]|nr:hypothetical protein [Myxococcaceae bacterium]